MGDANKSKRCEHCKRNEASERFSLKFCSHVCMKRRIKHLSRLVRNNDTTKRLKKLKTAKKVLNENLKTFASKIKGKNYRSDKWLETTWKSMGFFCSEQRCPDHFNRPLLGYIPDLCNVWFKYVIECDGSVHDLASVRRKDSIKDAFFIKNGYRVFRVKFKDEERLLQVGVLVKQIRLRRGFPPQKIHTKQRKTDPSFNSPILSKG